MNQRSITRRGCLDWLGYLPYTQVVMGSNPIPSILIQIKYCCETSTGYLMTLISGKLMYIGVISVITIAVASYGLFFLSKSQRKEYQRKHLAQISRFM